jgi:hypothetical protein
MESALLGIVIDSSILIAAERRKLTPEQAIETIQTAVGEVPIVYPVTESTAEIVAQIGAEQAAKGINVPWEIC